MNKETEIIVNGKAIKMNLPPDLQDSKIVIEDDKVFVEMGVVDYINNLKFENKELKEENKDLKIKIISANEAGERLEKLIKDVCEENQRLNNILKLKTDFIAELLKIILVSRDYELQDKCEIRAKMYEEKLKELKESDK